MTTRLDQVESSAKRLGNAEAANYLTRALALVDRCLPAR